LQDAAASPSGSPSSMRSSHTSASSCPWPGQRRSFATAAMLGGL
jgi:hypothetical protein